MFIYFCFMSFFEYYITGKKLCNGQETVWKTSWCQSADTEGITSFFSCIVKRGGQLKVVILFWIPENAGPN